jgi:hypothetical protein
VRGEAVSDEKKGGSARHLTQDVAASWVKARRFWSGVSLSVRSRSDEELAQYETIDTEAAKVLAAWPGQLLLGGLNELSDQAAGALAAHQGTLSLNGVRHLSLQTAVALAKHRGAVSLNGLMMLSDDAAGALSRLCSYSGLRLNGLTTLPVEVAKALAGPEGAWPQRRPGVLDKFGYPTGHLSLNGIRELSDDAAGALALFVGDLYLDGLISLSDTAAEGFAQAHLGRLSLRGLRRLSEQAALMLGTRHEGKVEVSVRSRRRLPTEAQEALSRHGVKWDQIALARGWFYDGGDGHWPWSSLDPGAAEILAECQMRLDLDKLTGLDASTASLLASPQRIADTCLEGVSLNGLTALSKETAAALAGGTLHFLSLDGLKDLPSEVAEALVSFGDEFLDLIRDGGSWELSLDGLTDLSVNSAKALARYAYATEDKDSWFTGILSLNRLATLPAEVAEALTGEGSPQSTFSWHLSLNGLKSLSLEAARALARHGEEEGSVCASLSLDRLTHLSDELAEVLAGHVGVLSLKGLTTLSDKAREALSRHKEPISLDGLPVQ